LPYHDVYKVNDNYFTAIIRPNKC